MTVEIKVPAMGESVTEATISKWFKKEGDAVKRDEPLLELETDKVTGEGTSTVTLSVSSSSRGSSRLTASPSFLNHLEMVASVTDSPIAGTLISTVILEPYRA